jgi:hypothetical protein
MKELKMSPNFSVDDDIHKLRLHTAKKYCSIPKEAAEKDFNFHYQSAKQTIESFRKKNKKAVDKD